jgi:hypothetical protein
MLDIGVESSNASKNMSLLDGVVVVPPRRTNTGKDLEKTLPRLPQHQDQRSSTGFPHKRVVLGTKTTNTLIGSAGAKTKMRLPESPLVGLTVQRKPLPITKDGVSRPRSVSGAINLHGLNPTEKEVCRKPPLAAPLKTLHLRDAIEENSIRTTNTKRANSPYIERSKEAYSKVKEALSNKLRGVAEKQSSNGSPLLSILRRKSHPDEHHRDSRSFTEDGLEAFDRQAAVVNNLGKNKIQSLVGLAGYRLSSSPTGVNSTQSKKHTHQRSLSGQLLDNLKSIGKSAKIQAPKQEAEDPFSDAHEAKPSVESTYRYLDVHFDFESDTKEYRKKLFYSGPKSPTPAHRKISHLSHKTNTRTPANDTFHSSPNATSTPRVRLEPLMQANGKTRLTSVLSYSPSLLGVENDNAFPLNPVHELDTRILRPSPSKDSFSNLKRGQDINDVNRRSKRLKAAETIVQKTELSLIRQSETPEITARLGIERKSKNNNIRNSWSSGAEVLPHDRPFAVIITRPSKTHPVGNQPSVPRKSLSYRLKKAQVDHIMIPKARSAEPSMKSDADESFKTADDGLDPPGAEVSADIDMDDLALDGLEYRMGK